MTSVAKWFLLSFAFIALAVSPRALAQGTTKPTPAKSADTEASTRVYEIQHVDAYELMREIEGLMGRELELRFVTDQRTNRIFAHGRAQGHDRFTQVIELMDTPDRTTMTKTFPISSHLLQSISRVMGNSVELSASDDMMLARGSAKSLDRLTDVVESLQAAYSEAYDSSVDADSPANFSVELKCLFEEPGNEEVAVAGTIAEQLREQGFQSLTHVGSMHVVATAAAGQRPISCSLAGAIDDATLEAEFQLSRRPRAEGFDVHLELALSRHAGDKKIEAPRLSTQLSVPLDRWIIVGSALAALDSSSQMPAPRCVFLLRVKPN